MSRIIYIGIDDTDIEGSTGTGRMARDLCSYLTGMGMGYSLGVTRHQLLVDDRIPYTSHNSSLCIGLETETATESFTEPSAEFLKTNFRLGSDPGLCICEGSELPLAVMAFGLKAQEEVLTKQEAIDLAAGHGIFLAELGGTGGGVIGALSGVGLRGEGNSGRYVDLPGIRGIQGVITVAELLARTDIEAVINIQEVPLDDDDIIDSRDWIRPSLYKGKPVLKVRPRLAGPGDKAWTSVELREREKQERKELLK